MKINHKQLINLPVYTELDQFVGHVIGFDLDVDHHVITHYFVGKRKLVDEILGSLMKSDQLVVANTQVVSITAEKMVVHEAVVMKNTQQAVEPDALAAI